VGKLWQLNHYHTYYCPWSLKSSEIGTFVHAAVCFLFVLSCLVLSKGF
jgi:hypothetical protein